VPAVPGVADLAGPPGPAVRVPAPGAAGAPLPAGPLPGVLPVVTEPAPAGAPATAARRFLPLPAAVAPAAAPAHRAAAGPASRPAAVGREPQPPGGRRERGGDGHGVDVDRLTDMVQARLLRRLAIERERRGR
jgi:hypothetical protein